MVCDVRICIQLHRKKLECDAAPIIRTKGPGKRGHTVADTLLLMMFLGLRKLGDICCGHKMFLKKITNIFCVLDTKFVSATNVARAGKRGNICVGNNESAKMCPRLPGPLRESVTEMYRKAARGNADLCKLRPSLNYYFSI